MADNYARLTDGPRRATVGGKRVLVSKLSPRGLGEIHAFLIGALESPLEQAKKAMEELPEEEAQKIWTAAVLEMQQAWPPRLDSETSIALMGTEEGRAVLLWVATRKHTDGMTRARARRLALRASGLELAELLSLIMPNAELGDPRDPDVDDAGVPYPEVRHQLIREFGWRPDEIDDLSFETLRLLASEGKTSKGLPVQTENQVAEAAMRWREYYVGL